MEGGQGPLLGYVNSHASTYSLGPCFKTREEKIGKPFTLSEFDLELGDKKKAEETEES